MTELNPNDEGWLNRVVASAQADLVRQFRPIELVQRGQTVTIPLPKDQADKLYETMNAHFYAWTGKQLHKYAPAAARKS